MLTVVQRRLRNRTYHQISVFVHKRKLLIPFTETGVPEKDHAMPDGPQNKNILLSSPFAYGRQLRVGDTKYVRQSALDPDIGF